VDWKQILPPAQCSYVLGNPPFVGKTWLTDKQREDMKSVCGRIKNFGLLDYVTGWYFKAADYIQGTRIAVGFVSTNSISQGEQVGILWGELFAKHHLKIHFAHRTFAWESEARGKAHVHVVIIGFGAFDVTNKQIYDYETDKPTVSPARNISPYLIEGNDVVAMSRNKPVCPVSEMVNGSKPVDGGNLILDDEEKADLLRAEPKAKKYIRRFIGSDEFINGINRWCLWLVDASPSEIREMPAVMARVEAVKKSRLSSRDEQTKKMRHGQRNSPTFANRKPITLPSQKFRPNGVNTFPLAFSHLK